MNEFDFFCIYLFDIIPNDLIKGVLFVKGENIFVLAVIKL